MSRAQKLRSLVEQRLTAAAQEIFGLFERTIAEYEEELSASRDENERQRRLLDAVFNPEVRVHRAGFPADLKKFPLFNDKILHEQQDWTSSLDQEDPEPPHIKEEQGELWTSQEEEQLQGLEEAGIKFKSEDDEEEAQSSQLHQRLIEQVETEADGKDFGGPEPDSKADPGRHPGPDKMSHSPETEDRDVGLKLWRETQSGFNTLRDDEVGDATNQPFIFSECNASVRTDRLQSHVNAAQKAFACQFCDKTFTKGSNLTRHLRVHTGEKPFACFVCHTGFALRSTLVNHMRVHTGEKPFGCSVCGRRFSKKTNLTTHAVIHTEEKPFKCSGCDKTFTLSSQVKKHKCKSRSFDIQY
ncbi:zinc finger protein 771-like [Clinocottus analis]|uniref:zinc finger protein 771-like n=1 Tax=Clinocottus analis TaxID=304258 RepID=UPI0035C0D629